MMRVERADQIDLNRLTRKSYGDDAALEQRVSDILNKVKTEGDKALYELTETLDKVDLRETGLKVSREEIAAAYTKVDKEYLTAIRQAKDNIYAYHTKQKRTSWLEPAADGTALGQLLCPCAGWASMCRAARPPIRPPC